MLASFRSRGFDGDDCEFLWVDNSRGNAQDAFAAYNTFLLEARGQYIILCHQDVLLLESGRRELDALLSELTAIDPTWGVCGNAGVTADHLSVIRISDPHGENQQEGGPFPRRVAALDENFMVVRRDRNLAVSHDLEGFHFYGPDLCLFAEMLGCTVYVIDFHLRHNSAGKTDASFRLLRSAFAAKYRHFFRPRWMPVATKWSVYISPSPTRVLLMRGLFVANKLVKRFAKGRDIPNT